MKTMLEYWSRILHSKTAMNQSSEEILKAAKRKSRYIWLRALVRARREGPCWEAYFIRKEAKSEAKEIMRVAKQGLQLRAAREKRVARALPWETILSETTVCATVCAFCSLLLVGIIAACVHARLSYEAELKQQRPFARATIADSRPDWIGQPWTRCADGGYTVALEIGPYSNVLQCDQEMPGALGRLRAEFAHSRFGSGDNFSSRNVELLELWDETRTYEIAGTMAHLHALVRFSLDGE